MSAVDEPDLWQRDLTGAVELWVEVGQPDARRLKKGCGQAERVVVDPVSFMHEQSETLAELDHELRERALERGLRFHRVPIPYAASAFISLLADLVEEVLGASPGTPALEPCICSPLSAAVCLNSTLRRSGPR